MRWVLDPSRQLVTKGVAPSGGFTSWIVYPLIGIAFAEVLDVPQGCILSGDFRFGIELRSPLTT